MEKSRNEENSLAKVLQAQAELLEKLTARVEQFIPPTCAEHQEVIRTHQPPKQNLGAHVKHLNYNLLKVKEKLSH